MSRLTTQAPTPLLSLAGFKKFTPEEYHKLGEAGIVQEGGPFELLEGYLVEKAIRNPPHEEGLRRLTARLPRRLPVDRFLQIQGAVAFGESEPEPDGAIFRGDETLCDGRLPTPADICLTIEVSDSTLAFDRRDKGRIYSRVGIPVYWIVNVQDRRIEVYTDPDQAVFPPVYANRTDYLPGQDVPIVLDGQQVGTVPAADLLP
jgi:Uma2 family endonuclease